METNDKNYVYLSNNPIKFDPASKVTKTNLFFDERNEQVFTVRSGGVTGVQVQGPTPELCHSFRMPDRGPIDYIKLSPGQSILALQRSKTSIEFINLRGKELEEVQYSQGSRNKSAIILGFVWSHVDEIIIVTDQGVELFQVFPEKRVVKALKNIATSVTWFVSCPATQIILLAGGPTSSNMQPISYANAGTISKAPKFQIEVPVTSSKGMLVERDVTVARLYGQTCILVLKHPPRPPSASQPPAQVLVYTMHKTLLTTRRTHTLALEWQAGRMALSVVDNLVLVHHQATRSTVLFDTGGDVDSTEPITVKALLPAQPIRPFVVELPRQDPFVCQLYSPNWVVFQPNIIMDAKLGFIWYVELDLKLLIATSPPPVSLVSMLLRRKQDTTLPLLLKVMEELTEPSTESPRDLSVIAQVFDTVNIPYKKQFFALAQHHIAQPASIIGSRTTSPPTKDLSPDMIVIDQSLMYSSVFSKFPEKSSLSTYDGEFAIKVILEYIRSLTDAEIPAVDLNELLITLLRNKDHGLTRLHLLLQYRVLSDSKSLACTLVSLEHLYPPLLQLSLDMLKRLRAAHDEIIEILLDKGLILPTLRYAMTARLEDHISARKFLEVAKESGNKSVFFSVYKFFEQRNQRLRGATGFAKGELCDPFVDHFRKMFIEQS